MQGRLDAHQIWGCAGGVHGIEVGQVGAIDEFDGDTRVFCFKGLIWSSDSSLDWCMITT